MKLIVTIEKQKDGTYIAYNTNDDNVTIIGTGDSVSAAKDDFFNSINETIEACKETGLSIPQSLKEEPEFRFDVASLFEYYKLINVSAFAEYIGINASLLRQYKLGSTYISDAQLQKIEDGIHSIGLEFTRLKLVWFTIDEWKECDIALLFLSVAGGILCSRFGPETTELATFKTNTCRYSRDTKVWDAVTDKPTELTLLTEGCVLTIGADDYRTQVLFNNSMLCADSIFVRYERAKGFGKWRKI